MMLLIKMQIIQYYDNIVDIFKIALNSPKLPENKGSSLIFDKIIF